MATPRQAHHCGYRSLLVSAVALVLAFRLPAQQPSVTTRHDAAAAAFAHGLMALHSAGVDRFAADHPAWDGRGVLIAILDSGIDPGVPGLATTSDGTPKILDLRDFSHEGRIALRPIIVRGDTLFIGDRRLLGGAQVAARVVRDAPLWGGTSHRDCPRQGAGRRHQRQWPGWRHIARRGRQDAGRMGAVRGHEGSRNACRRTSGARLRASPRVLWLAPAGPVVRAGGGTAG